MRVTILFLVSILSGNASAFIITADFEKGAVGSVAQKPNEDGFDNTAQDSRYVDSPALSGNQAGSVTVRQGENGFGRWGGAFQFPYPLSQGDSVWFRVNVYYPSGWDFDCRCSQGMKFMRIHTAAPSGSNTNQGYHSTLIKGGTTGGLITVDSEVNGASFRDNNRGPGPGDNRQGLGSPAPRNKWITYEMMIRFHSQPGQGIYRVWQDGELIFEDTKTATLRDANSISDFVYLYTYWNNGAPKTQTSYVDDIVITDVVPAKRDAQGNPYIGTGASVYIAPPIAPSQVELNQ